MTEQEATEMRKLKARIKYLKDRAKDLERERALIEAGTLAGIKAIQAEAEAEKSKGYGLVGQSRLISGSEKIAALSQGQEHIRRGEALEAAISLFREGYQEAAGDQPPTDYAEQANAEAMKYKRKLAAIRKAQRLTQTELAESLGVTFATINRLEKGYHAPSLKTKKAIDQYCDDHHITETD